MEYQLSVIIPTLNEAENIDQLITFIKNEKVKIEIIISACRFHFRKDSLNFFSD